MSGLAQSWCPTCCEWTLAEPGEPCAWCDTRVIRRRGGWERPDVRARSRISRNQALALHAAHTQGRSLRDLSRITWETLGYASDKSCLEGIRCAFDREALTCRKRIAAVQLSNRQRSTRLDGETRSEFKRRRRREYGYRDTRTGEWRKARQAGAEAPAHDHSRKEYP